MDLGISPFVEEGSCWSSGGSSGTWLRLSIRSIEAYACQCLDERGNSRYTDQLVCLEAIDMKKTSSALDRPSQLWIHSTHGHLIQ